MRYVTALAGVALLALAGGRVNGAAVLGYLLIGAAIFLFFRPRRHPRR